MKSNILARVFDWLSEIIDAANPSINKFLSLALPYITPLPVAILTAKSASQFLGFDQAASVVFVLALEGLGIMVTSLLVESIYKAINNNRSWGLVLLFGFVEAVYVVILVSINVTLHTNMETQGTMRMVVTLICFLPPLSGVGSTIYRIDLNEKRETLTKDERDYRREQERLDREVQRRIQLIEARKKAHRDAPPGARDSVSGTQAPVPGTYGNDPRGRALGMLESHYRDVGDVMSLTEAMSKGISKTTYYRSLTDFQSNHPELRRR
jgi:hypothetical protein